MDTSTLPGRGIKPWLSLRKHYRVSIVIWLLVAVPLMLLLRIALRPVLSRLMARGVEPN